MWIAKVAPVLLAAAACAQEVKVLADVPYQRVNGRELTLDAYLPPVARPAPVLVYIHGGGWRQGTKSSVPQFIRPAMLENGVAIVSVSYRLSAEQIWPAQGDDVSRAVQFVRSKAKEWNLDAARIAVMGESAGAHLALWVGLHDDRADRKAADPVARESTRVLAIVNYYGPTDFELVRRFPEKHGNPAYRFLMGIPPEQPLTVLSDEKVRDVSPVACVSKDDPPVFTAHGTGDQTVPVAHAESLIKALKKSGVTMENYLLEAGNHGLSNPLPVWPDHRKAAVEFLKRYLVK